MNDYLASDQTAKTVDVRLDLDTLRAIQDAMEIAGKDHTDAARWVGGAIDCITPF